MANVVGRGVCGSPRDHWRPGTCSPSSRGERRDGMAESVRFERFINLRSGSTLIDNPSRYQRRMDRGAAYGNL